MRPKEFVEQIWQTNRSSLVLLGLLLSLNLLLFVALEQLVTPKVAARESRFLQRQTEVRQMLRRQGGTAKTPEQHFSFASQDLARFQKSIPDYQDFTALIEELIVLSNRSKLEINQISYDSEKLKSNPLLKLNLSFNVVGDYLQVKKFIHSLEQSVRLITIKSISLQGEEGDNVNLRLNLETFFWPGRREL